MTVLTAADLLTAVGVFRREAEQTINLGRAVTILVEESEEFLEAVNEYAEFPNPATMEHLLKEAGDYFYVLFGLMEQILASGLPDEVAERLIPEDNQESVKQTMRILELMSDSFLNTDMVNELTSRIHTNNMAKLVRDEDGQLRRREDGKLLKPDDHQPPDLSDLAAEAIRVERARMDEAERMLNDVMQGAE